MDNGFAEAMTHAVSALAEQVVALDAVAFISKPIKKEALDAALEKANEKVGSAKHNGIS